MAGTTGKRVLIPLPSYGFDPTESAVPWKYLTEAGHKVTFSTPNGTPGRADVRLLTGEGLGVFRNSPLMTKPEVLLIYKQMEASNEFQNPIPYNQVQSNEIDALVLTGGHDKGMREYLESPVLQKMVLHFFEQSKPIGAICHGTLLVGKTHHPETGKSVLWDRKTTALTKWQELAAYNMTRLNLGDYYLTYPEILLEDEIRSYLSDPNRFERGPGWPIPLKRDTAENPDGFTLLDGNYLSARWMGDAHRFGKDFVTLLRNY